MSPLRLCHGKVELYVSRVGSDGPWLVSWPAKHWSCLVAAGEPPTPFWLRKEGLGPIQAEAVSEAWRRVVAPTLERIETLTGVIAHELRVHRPCPPTRSGQVEQLVDLTNCFDRALVAEALRSLERLGVVAFSVIDDELRWSITLGRTT